MVEIHIYKASTVLDVQDELLQKIAFKRPPGNKKVCASQGPGFLLDGGSPSASSALRFCDEIKITFHF